MIDTNENKLGGKIKALRKKRNMTQSELSDGFITRNMLSRVENGYATPSLDTLCNIAKRLDISPGWLLDDRAELSYYEKVKLSRKIKTLFAEKKYLDCELECKKILSETHDDEIFVIAAECAYNIAREKLLGGMFASSEMWFKKSREYNGGGQIIISLLDQTALAFIEYIKIIYPNSRMRDDFTDCEMPGVLPPYEGAVCVKLNKLIKNGEYGYVRACMKSGDVSGPCADQLSAALLLAEGDYTNAEALYRSIVLNAQLPAEIMYIACSELEKIARINEKYKLAYACAEKKLELINRAGK